MKRRKRSCSRRMPSAASVHWNGLPVPPGRRRPGGIITTSVGKYGAQVQALLKKAAALDIQTICPLHGPVLTGDLAST